MKLAVLFSGGKDSCYALMKAREKNEVVCLITIVSKNEESYMFHTPNIKIADLQAEAIGLPLIKKYTDGKKEEELKELKEALQEAKDNFHIDGVVTGALESVYQSTRIQRICKQLDLWCFNPLWKKDQAQLLREVLANHFKIIISGVFAYPLGMDWLGKEVDQEMVNKLLELQQGKYKISPSGEGGEFETTVLSAPFFHKDVGILEFEIVDKVNSGVYNILRADLK
jgi:diphthine-ammonia ligase